MYHGKIYPDKYWCFEEGTGEYQRFFCLIDSTADKYMIEQDAIKLCRGTISPDQYWIFFCGYTGIPFDTNGEVSVRTSQ